MGKLCSGSPPHKSCIMSSRTLLRLACKIQGLTTSSLLRSRGIRFLPSVQQQIFSTRSDPHVNHSNVSQPRLHLSKRRLVVNISGVEEEFPWVWLRDNCQCLQCFEPISHCRVVNLTEWNLNIKPVNVKSIDDGVEITWEDGHVSVFSLEWLAKRSFRLENRMQVRKNLGMPHHLWGKELLDDVPTANFVDIMNNDEALLNWLENLEKYGFVLVRNVPIEEGPVPALQKRVAFEKMTHYGPGYTVVVRADPANISHTHHRIFFHTDLTYYDYMAGAIFPHCIEQHQGDGGETMLTDGFHAAALLKAEHPEMYKLLSETVTHFRDVGTDYTQFDKISHQSFLIHNTSGELQRINWSHFARDTHLDVDLDKVDDLYLAMRTFDDLMNNEENHIRLKMAPGDMVTVKNQRILNGRSELQGGVSGRHLQCGYMDWDEIRSAIRVTRTKLGLSL